MKNYLKGALAILILVVIALCAADYFRKDEKKPETKHYPDKGSYVYYYIPPEPSETDCPISGIYFYDK